MLERHKSGSTDEQHGGRPLFNETVDQNGYAWWYVDALSHDGLHGITIIALIGSVFSPYYALNRRKGRSNPLHHVAMNVALYGAIGKRWAMTERGKNDITATANCLQIGPSAMSWDDSGLTVTLDEITAPFPRRIRGQMKLTPSAVQSTVYTIDARGEHIWQPIAPIADVEVSLSCPALTWKGHGYFDRNAGSSPLEDTFQKWHWSRANTGDTATVFYDVSLRSGEHRSLAIEIDKSGHSYGITPPPAAGLPTTGWRIGRATRSDIGTSPRIISTLEDTPFYARSIVSNRIGGRDAVSMHESLDLNRFAMPVVQAMLPFRMPRNAR